MGRAPCCDKVGIKKGRWTTDEDRILINYIKQNGEGSWRSMPKNAGLLRCGKSCRLRWINYLRSDLKRGNFTSHEQDIIIKLHASFGNKWSLIANQLPGRTDNEIKNYWNSSLSRKIDTLMKSNYISTRNNLGHLMTKKAPKTLLGDPAVDGVNDKNNVKKKKGKGRTSRATMKKKPNQVISFQHQHALKSVNASHLSTTSSNNSSCLSRCHSATSFGNCSLTVLTLPQTPSLEHVDDVHQGLVSSKLIESLLLDTSLATKNDIQLERPNGQFCDKLVVEVDEVCGVNSNGINSGSDKEMRLESMLGQEATVDNTQSSGFENCALASDDWDWENIAQKHANDQLDETIYDSSGLWDYYNNYSPNDHQQESTSLHLVDKNQTEAVVAWLLS